MPLYERRRLFRVGEFGKIYLSSRYEYVHSVFMPQDKNTLHTLIWNKKTKTLDRGQLAKNAPFNLNMTFQMKMFVIRIEMSESQKESSYRRNLFQFLKKPIRTKIFTFFWLQYFDVWRLLIFAVSWVRHTKIWFIWEIPFEIEFQPLIFHNVCMKRRCSRFHEDNR